MHIFESFPLHSSPSGGGFRNIFINNELDNSKNKISVLDAINVGAVLFQSVLLWKADSIENQWQLWFHVYRA